MAAVTARAARVPIITALLAGCGLALLHGAAHADAGWFKSGDVVMRNDLLLLNDAGVLHTPVSHWPIPRESVRYALENAKDHLATNAAVTEALRRVRARLDPDKPGARFTATARAGDASLLRDFDTLGRADAEVTAGMAYDSGRFSVSLNVTAAADPADGQEIRADGSHATVQLGNWLLSANTLERWWGPAHESSLILSNNARPMPTVLVERAQARPFESKWLSWLGPWRFSFGISQMENERQDIDSPLFMAWRVTIMPTQKVEIGFSRTAQFCGETMPCDLETFGNLIAGNDNPGFDATLETEPGNQMAGFDIRWNSPIGNGPYAIYGQMIGEDESSYMPVKMLAQFGLEVWKPLAEGGLVQMYAEWADTTCSAISGSGPYYNCAYNQMQFNVEGYRYRGRVIGHTTDRDSRSAAVGATYTRPRGDLWSVTLRASELNHDDNVPDGTHSLTPGPADYAAFELGWQGEAWGGKFGVEVGVESFEPLGQDRDVEPYGFISWRHDFAP